MLQSDTLLPTPKFVLGRSLTRLPIQSVPCLKIRQQQNRRPGCAWQKKTTAPIPRAKTYPCFRSLCPYPSKSILAQKEETFWTFGQFRTGNSIRCQEGENYFRSLILNHKNPPSSLFTPHVPPMSLSEVGCDDDSSTPSEEKRQPQILNLAFQTKSGLNDHPQRVRTEHRGIG